MDKIEKIRAEIKKRYNYEKEMYCDTKPDGRPNDGWAESLAIMGVLGDLLSFLDTLEEEPDKSLEEEIRRYLREECSSDDEPTTSETACHFAEWADRHKGIEWSEEDKRKLNRIYEILGYAADDKGFLTSKRIIGDKEAIELQDFLKSLSPSWKPSEEQMKALEECGECKRCIKELYEQLSKRIRHD